MKQKLFLFIILISLFNGLYLILPTVTNQFSVYAATCYAQSCSALNRYTSTTCSPYPCADGFNCCGNVKPTSVPNTATNVPATATKVPNTATKAPTSTPYCLPAYNSPDNCPCGCTKSSTGGSCTSPCPTNTKAPTSTPIPVCDQYHLTWCLCGCTANTCDACPNTPTNTPIPCKAIGLVCATNSQCCSNRCSNVGLESYCVINNATSTKTPTPTVAQTCPIVGDSQCVTNYSSQKCLANKTWSTPNSCNFPCSGSPSISCKDGQCCPDPASDNPYCVGYCSSYCSGTQKLMNCWANYQTYLNDPDPQDTSGTLSSGCQTTTTACNECVSIWERCGGTATCPQGQYPWWNSCSDNYCSSVVCGPVPTGCTPNCSCAASLCSTETCSDGCNGTCHGTNPCYGTVQAKAVITESCNTIATADPLNDTTITLNGTDGKTQTNGDPVTWTNVPIGSYTVSATNAISTLVPKIYCIPNGSGYSEGSSQTLETNESISFFIGFAPPNGWVQAIGGDVYAKTQLTSSVPATYYFSLAGAMGDAGIVSYGTPDGYDFSLSDDNGETQVSLPPARLVYNPNNPSLHLYELFATQFDIPGDTPLLESAPLTVTKPACGTSPCVFYVSGDLETTSGSPWTIGSTEQMVVFVSGSAHIHSPITITPGGFFALIVNGTISVDSTVGEPAANTTPALEGIYITNQFETGTSDAVGTERLNIKGSVIADTFLLNRSLGISNATLPAEQFTFNPQLLFTMPDKMKEIPYVWQEVAP